MVKAAFNDSDTDILARKSLVSDVRMYRRFGRVGVGVVECGLKPSEIGMTVITTEQGDRRHETPPHVQSGAGPC